ncbi:MAG: mandelate racemase [Pseudomonadota bacterium]
MNAPRLSLVDVVMGERPVRLRLPFRFGVVTLRETRQIFVKATVRLADGRLGDGVSAELLIPKWFDKSPELSNEDNANQLRKSLAIAVGAYGQLEGETPFGLHAAAAGAVSAGARAAALPQLVSSYGPALLDRAILDAVLRLEGLSVFAGVKNNVMGLTAATAPDLAQFDLSRFLETLTPARSIAVRHTVGLADPLTEAETAAAPLNDGLPQSLEAVIAHYGITYFKLKVSGDQDADIKRLIDIAALLDRLPDYVVTLDGNEQYVDAASVVDLWRAMEREPRLARLRDAVVLIEQPIARTAAFAHSILPLAAIRPVEIDESDGDIGAFLTAKRLGYTCVSSKSCKGFYRALLNAARCASWNAQDGSGSYFMSAEDLTTQAGIAVQQDLALATLVGAGHVERNGHHYVRGMAGAGEQEVSQFLEHHGDLYEPFDGGAKLSIKDGRLNLTSLDTVGLASAVIPDFDLMDPSPAL